ncbi:NUMOD1 domain-containing DNA-binding protein [Bacillus sp. S13(2024)]|uniref:NUMOD1 domain-containing DNA-binding protein n=1 Tax=Bacillus sp. S13(2024) TaxID=3162885 RepID=UPI003D2207F6
MWNKRYDFFIPDFNCLIETHGEQHYIRSFSKAKRSLEEEKENDAIKEDLAKNNGINKYIVLNCSKSYPGYMKDVILKSELSKMFNMENIDWGKCEKLSSKSLVIEVCKLWREGLKDTKLIAERLKLGRNTVVRYLKSGKTFGWCDYNSQLELKKGRIKNSGGKRFLQFSLEGTFIGKFKSIAEAERITNTNNIWMACSGKRKTAGGFKWAV